MKPTATYNADDKTLTVTLGGESRTFPATGPHGPCFAGTKNECRHDCIAALWQLGCEFYASCFSRDWARLASSGTTPP